MIQLYCKTVLDGREVGADATIWVWFDCSQLDKLCVSIFVL